MDADGGDKITNEVQPPQRITPFSTFMNPISFTVAFNLGRPVVESDQLRQGSELDLVLLPLVAFDQHGSRVGMGVGFYDTTFEFVREQKAPAPVLVGIAHEIQKVDTIESESWDVPLATVVTDQGVYHSG